MKGGISEGEDGCRRRFQGWDGGAMGAGSGKGECRKEGVKEDGVCGGGPCWRPGGFTKEEVSWMGRFSSKMGGGRVWG